MAGCDDVPGVTIALEAGNSPQMIFQHYCELVRPEAAKAWFAIVLKNLGCRCAPIQPGIDPPELPAHNCRHHA